MKHDKLALLAGCVVVAAFFAGCETTSLPDPYDYTVSLDPSLRGASVQVDLIGIPEGELEQFRTKSVTAYWQPGDADREGALKKTLVFSADTAQSQMLSRADPVWADWIENGNAAYVVILADLPGLAEDQMGNADPRRLILPLNKEKWEERPEVIAVAVGADSVSATPTPLESY